MGDLTQVPRRGHTISRSINAATAFRAQPTDPTDWTQVGTNSIWWANWPDAAEMAADAPDSVWYDVNGANVQYTAQKPNDTTNFSDLKTGRFYYDAANRKLYINNGDRFTNPDSIVVEARVLDTELLYFMIVNRTDNTKRINWTLDGTTPAPNSGVALKPGEDSGLIPWFNAHAVQIKPENGDANKYVDIVLLGAT